MELLNTSVYESPILNFNSIKVRLEYGNKSDKGIITVIFQFHKGAIGVNPKPPKHRKTYIFQFHKGAIGVNFQIDYYTSAGVFQFHKGAIGVFSYGQNEQQ